MGTVPVTDDEVNKSDRSSGLGPLCTVGSGLATDAIVVQCGRAKGLSRVHERGAADEHRPVGRHRPAEQAPDSAGGGNSRVRTLH